MHINLETTEHNAIQTYSDTKIQINSIIYEKSLIVSKQKIIKDLPIFDIDDITDQQLDLLTQINFKTLIVGHQSTRFPPRELLNKLAQLNIGVEWMSIGAAARTYNVLLSEEREVAALFVFKGN